MREHLWRSSSLWPCARHRARPPWPSSPPAACWRTPLRVAGIPHCNLGLSHVNDSGFWIVTRYLGLSVGDGLRTWTVLTTVLGIAGFAFTALLWVAVA
eukprot:gene39331-48594_t